MGKFIIRKTKTGFTFYLNANNTQTICASQVYSSLATCKNGIESVRKNCNAKIEDQTLKKFEALKNPKYEIYLDKAGEYRFRLNASNGEILVLANGGYTTKAACRTGIESIGKNALDAPVEMEE
jgi:uncharacterized protein YegP (UPF0339 family)